MQVMVIGAGKSPHKSGGTGESTIGWAWGGVKSVMKGEKGVERIEYRPVAFRATVCCCLQGSTHFQPAASWPLGEASVQ